jgi:hypothetical protein
MNIQDVRNPLQKSYSVAQGRYNIATNLISVLCLIGVIYFFQTPWAIVIAVFGWVQWAAAQIGLNNTIMSDDGPLKKKSRLNQKFTLSMLIAAFAGLLATLALFLIGAI